VDLYFILFAISALGIIGLALIFGAHIKPKKRDDDIDEQDQIEQEAVEQNNIATISAHDRVEPVISDPELSSLGFSALDNLFMEPQQVAAEDDDAVDYEAFQRPTHIRKSQHEPDSDLITLFLMAPNKRPFAGYELLQALQAAGLRFGDMNIFHRYAETEEEAVQYGPILFSVASAVEPGIFDLANIGAFFCPGLTLFMMLQPEMDQIQCFELLLETAEQLAQDLDGTVCDDDHQPLTEERLKMYREILH
jgi:cell division protein ZipA